jgi:hypothetical protein
MKHRILTMLSIASVLSPALVQPLPTLAKNDPPPTAAVAAYAPASTTVAILPVANKAKSKDAGMTAKQTAEADKDIASAFAQHGFKVLDANIVATAVSDSHIDLDTDKSWTAANLALIGQAAHADLVVLLVINDTHQGYRHGFLASMAPQREGEAKTKLWLVASSTNTAVIDGISKDGKARASAMKGYLTGGFGEGSSSYVLKAIGDAINQSLSDFMKPYPILPTPK